MADAPADREPDTADRSVLHRLLDGAGRIPLTLGYGGLLLATSAARATLPAPTSQAISHLSTNLDNLSRHPVRAIVGSAMFLDGSVGVNLVFGLVPLAISEYRIGSRRAAVLFASGHIGATLITAQTIRWGIRTGYYPAHVTTATDVGLSYGALAVRFGAIGAVAPGRATTVDATRAVGLLSLTQPWQLPADFTATGHAVAATIGVIGALFIRWRGSRR